MRYPTKIKVSGTTTDQFFDLVGVLNADKGDFELVRPNWSQIIAMSCNALYDQNPGVRIDLEIKELTFTFEYDE